MFVALKNIIPKAIEKHGLRKRISALTEKERIEKAIRAIVKKEVRVVKREGKKVAVRGGNFTVAQEIRLREEEIKKILEKENIHIETIRHVV
ncbi:MAG: hypothetical protein AAB598_00320 [Patescibacteria group bacterium]